MATFSVDYLPTIRRYYPRVNEYYLKAEYAEIKVVDYDDDEDECYARIDKILVNITKTIDISQAFWTTKEEEAISMLKYYNEFNNNKTRVTKEINI